MSLKNLKSNIEHTEHTEHIQTQKLSGRILETCQSYKQNIKKSTCQNMSQRKSNH